MRSARNNYFKERGKERDPRDLGSDENFLVESSKIEGHAKRSKAYIKVLEHGSNATKPEGEQVTAPSCLRMLEEHYRVKSDVIVEDLLPRGIALRDSLLADQEYTKTWHQPRLEKSSSVPMTHYVHSVSNFNKMDFLLEKANLDKSCENQQRNHWNTTIAPCFIQTIKITQDNYDSLLKAKVEGKTSFTFTVPMDHPKLIEVPLGYTVSDGISDSLSVIFPWERISDNTNKPGMPISHTFKFTFTKLPHEILSYLQDQQMKITDKAKYLSHIVNSFLEDFYDIKGNIKFVDIASVAVAAGCRMDSLDLCSLSCVTFGVPFPWDIEFMDQMWGYSDDDQSDLIYRYMCNKLVILWELFQVFMGCLIRNLFADPDITLYALRMAEDSFISWFNHFVCSALMNTDPKSNSPKFQYYGAKSRSEMLLAIKDGDNSLLDQLAELFINVPVVPCGGAKFLHHVRNAFFKQFSVLEFIHLPTYIGEQPRPRDNLLDNKFELMFKREYVIDDSGSPVVGWDLQPSPQFAGTIYNLNIESASAKDIKFPKKQHDREIIPALSEWARLNYEKLVSVFILLKNLDCTELKEFWVERIRCYDYMRGCHSRLTGSRLGVRTLDLITAKREDHTKRFLERSAGVNPSRTESARISMFDGLANGENDDRVGLHQSVYASVPGFNNKRNREIADVRVAKRLALREKNPNWVPEREYKKSKRLRVLNEVEDQMNNSSRPSTSRDSPSQSSSRGFSSGGKHISISSQTSNLSSADLRHRASTNKSVSQSSGSGGKHVSTSSQTRNLLSNDLRNRIDKIRGAGCSNQKRYH